MLALHPGMFYSFIPTAIPTIASVITTIAGSGSSGYNTGSFSGDNGAATSATLNGAGAVTVDSSGIS